MEKDRVRFGKYIRGIRIHDLRELTQADVAEALGINPALYGMIENNKRPPFDSEKMEIFAKLFDLTGEQKGIMYDLAARETDEAPADIKHIFMNSEIGNLSRQLFRELQNGDFEEERWKTLAREAYKEAQRQKGEESE